ncbi:hypothetical protein ACFOD4_04615 [Pseudoroseomonas globiformis]|uniref:Histidine phosphatase family protein n=1 Tax=Teichococcus globiformis TaxID=2307229 RepID=A0ABV7FVX0_9PROT
MKPEYQIVVTTADGPRCLMRLVEHPDSGVYVFLRHGERAFNSLDQPIEEHLPVSFSKISFHRSRNGVDSTYKRELRFPEKAKEARYHLTENVIQTEGYVPFFGYLAPEMSDPRYKVTNPGLRAISLGSFDERYFTLFYALATTKPSGRISSRTADCFNIRTIPMESCDVVLVWSFLFARAVNLGISSVAQNMAPILTNADGSTDFEGPSPRPNIQTSMPFESLLNVFTEMATESQWRLLEYAVRDPRDPVPLTKDQKSLALCRQFVPRANLNDTFFKGRLRVAREAAPDV